jgi:hypothetical protein
VAERPGEAVVLAERIGNEPACDRLPAERRVLKVEHPLVVERPADRVACQALCALVRVGVGEIAEAVAKAHDASP